MKEEYRGEVRKFNDADKPFRIENLYFVERVLVGGKSFVLHRQRSYSPRSPTHFVIPPVEKD
jgi:hypothetical protein